MEKVVLLLLLSSAVVCDWKRDSIPNALCLIGMMLGAAFQYYFWGWKALLEAGFASVCLFFSMLPLWQWKVLGAGDIKLLMMAAFYLRNGVFWLIVISAVITAIYSFVLMIVRGNLKERLCLFNNYLRTCIIDGELAEYPFDRKDTEECQQGGIRVSYGILTGFLLGWLLGKL